MTTPTASELRALIEAALPLSWDVSGGGIYDAVGDGRAYDCSDSDAELIAAAVNALPGHLDRIAALEAALRECADTLEESNTYVQPYFVVKHDLAAPIGRARKLLESKP